MRAADVPAEDARRHAAKLSAVPTDIVCSLAHVLIAGRSAVTPFAIIPVLDLKRGHVVRARAGDRANYHPIVTPLASGSTPAAVLRGLLDLAPFCSVYVADLDAIAGVGGHREIIRAIGRETPELEIWLDGGFVGMADAREALQPGLRPVLGTESLAGPAALADAVAVLGRSRVILSLDYRGGRFLGLPEIEHNFELWPDRLILMTLDRVGMGEGPDLAALQALVRRAEGRAVFAAGGVRGEADVAALRASGVAGALVASALHDGSFAQPTLERILR
jgi:uncharacterized protein related to proFAR isomerase